MLKFKAKQGSVFMCNEKERQVVDKLDNKYLLEKQLETLKLFYERKLLTKEQYDFEYETLTTKIKTDKE